MEDKRSVWETMMSNIGWQNKLGTLGIKKTPMVWPCTKGR